MSVEAPGGSGAAPQRRVALISGASRGIGAAVARQLDASGWALSLGMRTPAALDGLAGDAHVARHDALNADEDDWVNSALAHHGRIDAVICCAGVMIPQSAITIGDDDLDRMWEINVKSPRRLVAAAWPELCRPGNGRVVIAASLSGKRVKTAASGAYAITKHAAVALGHGLRQAGWESGIRTTILCPGFVDTDMAREITDFPSEHMTRPIDVARLVELSLDLPNSAALTELTVNCQIEEQY